MQFLRPISNQALPADAPPANPTSLKSCARACTVPNRVRLPMRCTRTEQFFADKAEYAPETLRARSNSSSSEFGSVLAMNDGV